MNSKAGISRQLAEFVVSTKFEQLDDKAVRYCRYALLDAIGVSVAASRLGEGVQPFIEWVKAQESKPECSVFAQDFKASASLAAFANGALAHALDFEDAHDQALVHPNAAVVPAVLAIAQVENVSGQVLLTAIAVGCEIVCRLGLSLTVKLDDYAWYPPPILSAYGATAAAAHLLKLNVEQTVNAFSLTLLQATCSAEIKYNPQSNIRAIRDAFPAQAGVVAAQLAQKGIKGFEQPFEGKAGFFQAFARGNYRAENLIENLGQSFEVTNLSFKPWPSCRGTHTAIELVLLNMKDHNLLADDIDSIVVYGSKLNSMLAEPIESKRRPQSAIDAKFSIPFCIACAVVGNDVNIDSFHQDTLKDELILALAAKVSYVVDEKLTTMLSSRIEITTGTGKKICAESDSAYGCPDRPLSEQDLINKFISCLNNSSRTAHKTQAGTLVNTVLNIDQMKSLEPLFTLL